jgi:hypothetical protein
MRRFWSSIGVILASVILAEAAAPRESLRDVLRRGGEYVVDYGRSLERVVADELYTQRFDAKGGGRLLRSRVIKAEIAFVRLADSREWQAFRNAIEVDGQPLPGAQGRLDRLFRSAPRSIIGQARAIAEESARYNIGPLRRDFNAPTMPLQFLQPSHQDRFRFDKVREETAGPDRMWVVRFRERNRATLIRSPEGRNVPVEGLFWIVPDSGRVMRASFSASDFLPEDPGPKHSRANLDVIWKHDPKLDLWVPAEMHELYSGPWTEEGTPFDISGTAVYSNYRRFDVDVRIVG